MKISRPLLLYFFINVGGTDTIRGDSVTGYEPCHLLCSNEAGRSELRQIGDSKTQRAFSLRLETIYISARGHYEEGAYRSIPEGVRLFILESLPSLGYQPTENLRFTFGIPLEYNSFSGVVLPTLKPSDLDSTRLEPGGVFASVHISPAALKTEVTEPWIGIGYRLSSPIGTADVSGSL